MSITDRLLSLADIPYRDFTAKLIPTINKERIIGVRTPAMRTLAKELLKQQPKEAMAFLQKLPHYYYEENNLHAFIIAQIKDFEKAMQYTTQFLPYIDNWATCDTFAPKIFLKYPQEVLSYIQQWIKSSKTYTVRYAIGILLSNYLDEHFKPVYLDWVAASRRVKLRSIAEGGDARAARILGFQDQPGLFFTTVQIGLNAVAILAGIVGDSLLSPAIRDLLPDILGPALKGQVSSGQF